MPEERKQAVYVIGHTNPDTDSICSAIAYAALKKKSRVRDIRPEERVS